MVGAVTRAPDICGVGPIDDPAEVQMAEPPTDGVSRPADCGTDVIAPAVCDVMDLSSISTCSSVGADSSDVQVHSKVEDLLYLIDCSDVGDTDALVQAAVTDASHTAMSDEMIEESLKAALAMQRRLRRM